MKSKYLPLLTAVIILCFNACKKDSNGGSNQIVGKWNESKLEIEVANSTPVARDTTFTATSFTKDDYFQFTSDKKATFSQSGIYSITGKAIAISGGTVDIGLAHFTWSIAGAALTLNVTDRFPLTQNANGPTSKTQTIVQLDATHLVLRVTDYSGQPLGLTTTSYFTKGK
jgi:hypothetical protein